jgi:hypothetical protein
MLFTVRRPQRFSRLIYSGVHRDLTYLSTEFTDFLSQHEALHDTIAPDMVWNFTEFARRTKDFGLRKTVNYLKRSKTSVDPKTPILQNY